MLILRWVTITALSNHMDFDWSIICGEMNNGDYDNLWLTV